MNIEALAPVDGIIITGGSLDENLAVSCMKKMNISGLGMYHDNMSYSQSCQRVIAADAGLVFCMQHGLLPAHIVGDFDSAGKAVLNQIQGRQDVTIHVYDPEKDYTDTEIAVELAISLGWKTILILGATGTRLDHVLGNIQVLSLALSKGCQGILLDTHNRIRLFDTSFVIKKEDQWGDNVSLFAFGGPVPDLTLRGFHYELDQFFLGNTGSLTVSNCLDEEEGLVQFTSGNILCIESSD